MEPKQAAQSSSTDAITRALQEVDLAQARYRSAGAEANQVAEQEKVKAKNGDPRALAKIESAEHNRAEKQKELIQAQNRLAKLTGGDRPHAGSVAKESQKTPAPPEAVQDKMKRLVPIDEKPLQTAEKLLLRSEALMKRHGAFIDDTQRFLDRPRAPWTLEQIKEFTQELHRLLGVHEKLSASDIQMSFETGAYFMHSHRLSEKLERPVNPEK
jgi:hypothetical protein